MSMYKIESLFSPDAGMIDEELFNWKPDNIHDVIVFFEVEIGMKGSVSSYIFSISFITTKALERKVKSEGFLSGSGYFVSERYSFDKFRKWLEKIVSDCKSSSWEEASIYFNHYLTWEYHNCYW